GQAGHGRGHDPHLEPGGRARRAAAGSAVRRRGRILAPRSGMILDGMSDPVAERYQRLLSRRFEWMLGGAVLQLQQAARLVAQLELSPRGSGRAADLGGGPGFFAIALARRGFEVDLVDTSELLLERARAHAQELPVRTHAEDLLAYLSRTDGGLQLC